MPESFDGIPIDEMLIFVGSDRSSYVVIERDMSTEKMFAALGWSEQ